MLVTKLMAVLKDEVGRNGAEALRIERQQALQPQQRVEQQKARRIEGQHGERVGLPVLLRAVIAAQAAKCPLDGREHGRESGPLA